MAKTVKVPSLQHMARNWRDTPDIPRLDEGEKRAMLGIFAEGYRLARSELAGAKPDKDARNDTRRPDPGQRDLFNPDGDQ